MATILLVAITVVLAAVLYILVMNYTSSTASRPELSTSLALGSPQESVSRSSLIPACATTVCNFYNMSVQSAGNGLELHDLAFEIIGQNGANLVPPGGIAVLNATNVVVSQYGWSTGWSTAGATLVSGMLTFVLYTSGTTPQSLSSDTLRVIGVAAFSGSITVHIF